MTNDMVLMMVWYRFFCSENGSTDVEYCVRDVSEGLTILIRDDRDKSVAVRVV